MPGVRLSVVASPSSAGWIGARHDDAGVEIDRVLRLVDSMGGEVGRRPALQQSGLPHNPLRRGKCRKHPTVAAVLSPIFSETTRESRTRR
jgi:hypothetical protein